QSNAPALTTDDMEDYKKLVHRLYDLCDYSETYHTRIMIDAEQSYFQHAVDHLANSLERRYNKVGNKHGPLILNTYQMYLKAALGKLKLDFERAQREGYTLGVKLVRGAYMVSERKR